MNREGGGVKVAPMALHSDGDGCATRTGHRRLLLKGGCEREEAEALMCWVAWRRAE